MSLRSSYEVRVANVLDVWGIVWEYEHKRFDLGTCTYLPDFYLPESNSYVEAKGYFDPKSKMRVRMFREQYPEHPLVVATNDVITMMEDSKDGCRNF